MMSSDYPEKPCTIHRWKFYAMVVVKGNILGGKFYNVREAWEFAREELGYRRHQIRINDHTNRPSIKVKNLP